MYKTNIILIWQLEITPRKKLGRALYFMVFFDCLELDEGDDRVECLGLRIKGKAKADILTGVCYRPPNQDAKADKLVYKNQGDVT